MNTGIRSSLNETGRSSFALTTFTGTFTVWLPCVTLISVVPSATGYTVNLSSLTSEGFAKLTCDCSVTSRVMPSGWVSWTTNDCRSRAVSRLMSGG